MEIFFVRPRQVKLKMLNSSTKMLSFNTKKKDLHLNSKSMRKLGKKDGFVKFYFSLS